MATNNGLVSALNSNNTGSANPATQSPLPAYQTPSAPVQTSTYMPQPLTETGEGTTYTGMSQEEILAQQQKGLVSILDEGNPLMKMAAAEGARSAEARGLGGSSLRERASQAAVYDAAMPLVQRATELSSAERVSAQQATAQSEISAASRRLSELLQQYELAVQSNDAAAARQTQSQIAQEANNLAQWQTQAQIGSSEFQQQRDLEAQQLQQQADRTLKEQQAAMDRELQTGMQGIDIDYKKWLEDVTFKHQGILQGNAQAAGAHSDFNEAAMNIMNNPETSTPQKISAIKSIKEALESSLSVISTTANIDLSKFLPASVAKNNATEGTPEAPKSLPPKWMDEDGIPNRYSRYA